MDVTAASTVDSMASRAEDAVDVAVLNKAVDVQAQQMTQLLQSLPSAPQADNKGTLVDVHV